MKSTKVILIAIVVSSLFACTNSPIQDSPSQSSKATTKADNSSNEHLELHKTIMEKDSLLFEVGFNLIDTAQVAKMTYEDFEFYHDEHGITDSKAAFVGNIQGISELPFKTWRNLVKNSTEVFPLHRDNSQVLYGAIQTGEHEFYQQNDGEEARKTNIAKFTHLWIIQDGQWKLKRVLSYDHQVPKIEAN